ncbi:hypothetical protein FRB99_004585 [Tulasnella sp. 403]|nr:hypothetical protein FRB99_004585 [Tulasnella sp. 403]
MSVRLAPLAERETGILGTRASGAVSRAREAVLRRRLGLLNHVDTGFMVWQWIIWHGVCWETRLQAWRSVLTNDGWWGKSPLDAMHEATKHNFCHECRGQLHGWLRLDDDNGVAENTMKQHLGDDPERWINAL